MPLRNPVELISFSGKLRNEEVLLNWSTATEINNDYFLLEKSTDGRNFEKLGTTPGKGTTSEIQQYNYVDPRPAVGVNYYRLTQVDYDGSSEVAGKIVAVTYNKDGAISVQPNPVSGDQLQLIYQTETKGALEVEIYSATGQLVKKQLLDAEADRNVFDLSLTGLSKGIYIVRATQNGNVQALRFVKR